LIVGCVSHTVHRMIGWVLGGDPSLFHVRIESINIERYRRVHGVTINHTNICDHLRYGY
jgi:hypothetical protein